MSDWISIDDRQPPYGCEVLVTDGDAPAELCTRTHTDADGEHYETICCQQEYEEVTHWMLPPPAPSKAAARR